MALEMRLRALRGPDAPWGARRAAILARSEEDTKVLDLLKTNPLRQSAIADATGAKVSTMQQRLKRLEAKGLVYRDESRLWSATATVTS
jgi:predicted transcriptional regulator